MPDHQPFDVLIVRGGHAALEAASRLQRVAGSATQTTILAPDTRVAARPMTVLAPFAARHPGVVYFHLLLDSLSLADLVGHQPQAT